MTFEPTDIKDVWLFRPRVFEDSRGYFFESYNEMVFHAQGILDKFVQDNQSSSVYGVIRGLHYQLPPFAQSKLVRVLRGKILDVVVDIRKGSRTFGQVYYCTLDSERRNMLMVPEGFAHGFAALEDTLFYYKCTNLYHKTSESGILWNDPHLNIKWPVDSPIVSEKDRVLPEWNELLRKSVISPV